MNRPLAAMTSRLTYGETKYSKRSENSGGLVETLARVYEKARNTLEYRADNLVRRAAIERILKRRIVLNRDPESLADKLLTELKWAKYLSFEEVKLAKKLDLPKILEKYTSHLKGNVPQEWILKIASAEIEELFNLNTDYKQFTFFAFQIIRQKVEITDENTDLLVFFAVDKIYAGSDDEQIAYHILNLAGEPLDREKLNEAWKLFNLAKSHKETSRLVKFVRRQMPPLVLLRDLYFYNPGKFRHLLENSHDFTKEAAGVLEIQLEQMSEKIRTAGIRSVLYVFLTKMVFAFGLEIPFEILIYGYLNKLPLAVNVVFPPLLMWVTTMQIHLPKNREQQDLIERTWHILTNYESLKEEDDVLTNSEENNKSGFGYWAFSILYAIFFVGIFAAINFVLGVIGYTFFSKIIFVFFLTVIAFFAYRISQIAKTYSWKTAGPDRSTLMDIISIPILTIGSRLSRGLSKLNFLTFAFDFILEAPFKIILGFVDDWVQFLSVKKDEEIVE